MPSPPLDIRAHVPLAERTSLGLGGPAEFYAELAAPEQVPEALAWASARSLPVTVLGGGSNVVVADAGITGLVLTPTLATESTAQDGEHVLVTVGAGAHWDDFVSGCVAREWSGLECLSGIPGRVGATPIQNVGAYGQEVAESLVSVQAHDRQSGRIVSIERSECGFAYRTSRFKSEDAGRFIVLAVTFRLRAGGAGCVAYPEIARRFGGPGAAPARVQQVREAVLDTRREKSMLLDARDENTRSCGSFFLNPQLTASELAELETRGPIAPPRYAQSDGRFKVPAAWLIEQAGFRRGQRWGPVGISTRHSLALVCHTGATSRRLIEAAHRVRDGVARAFGIWLTPEPQFLGFGLKEPGLPPLA